MQLKKTLASLLLAAAMMLSTRAMACPLCSEAVSASSAGASEEKNEFPAAMNQSIYLMISVPYLALGVVGFMIYRGCNQNAAYLQRLQQPEPGPATSAATTSSSEHRSPT